MIGFLQTIAQQPERGKQSLLAFGHLVEIESLQAEGRYEPQVDLLEER
jgi:hypothetical protein